MEHSSDILSKIRETDAFLVSYPRSGNTWTRMVLGTTVLLELAPDQVHSPEMVRNVSEVIPDLHAVGVLRNTHERLKIQPVFKSHSWIGSRSNLKVCLFRHPEDVFASYYHYAQKLAHVDPGLSINDFAYGNLPTWLAFYQTVIKRVREEEPSARVFCYEKLFENPVPGFRAMLQALKLPYSEESLERAIGLNSWDQSVQRLVSPNVPADFPMLRGKPGSGRLLLAEEVLKKVLVDTLPVYEELCLLAQ